jgi:hypothetical protein
MPCEYSAFECIEASGLDSGRMQMVGVVAAILQLPWLILSYWLIFSS